MVRSPFLYRVLLSVVVRRYDRNTESSYQKSLLTHCVISDTMKIAQLVHVSSVRELINTNMTQIRYCLLYFISFWNQTNWNTYRICTHSLQDLKYVHVFPKMLIKKPEDTAHTVCCEYFLPSSLVATYRAIYNIDVPVF